MRNIFVKRTAMKPYEYPEVVPFRKAISHSYWTVDEWNFVSDVHDFYTKLNPVEQSAIKNALLAISQIEVSVKRFWTKLGDRFPKPEIEEVGVTFGESEVRHSEAYSHLLTVLDLNHDFNLLLEQPVIQGRVDYLQKYLKGAADSSDEAFALTLCLFALFIENISLFSQFVVIKSFNKHRNLLKDIDNVIQATQQEENLHARFGIQLLEFVKQENPDWFNEDFYDKVDRASKKAYAAEEKIIDWIFEAGELSFLPKAVLKEWIKSRFNDSVSAIGGRRPFEVDQAKVDQLSWFDEELLADANTDFFHKRPVSYSKSMQSITADDLF